MRVADGQLARLWRNNRNILKAHITFCFSCNEGDQSWYTSYACIRLACKHCWRTYAYNLGPDSIYSDYLSFRLFFDPECRKQIDPFPPASCFMLPCFTTTVSKSIELINFCLLFSPPPPPRRLERGVDHRHHHQLERGVEEKRSTP